MLRAVPSIVLMAASRSFTSRSVILSLAISSTLARGIRPHFSRFGVLLPFSSPAALRSRTDAGGVLVMKAKDRSAYTVITTGMIIPSWDAVFALNALQNSMMLTPCCPRAGPTGGEGFAFPRGNLELDLGYALLCHGPLSPSVSAFFDLGEIELDGRRPPEDGHEDDDLPLVGLAAVDDPAEVAEHP